MFQTRLLNKKNSSRYKVHEYCIYFLRADDQGLNSFKCQKYNDFNENTIKKFNVIDLLFVLCQGLVTQSRMLTIV